MNFRLFLIFFLLGLLALAGCHRGTEEQRYERLKSGLKYRTYKTLSKETVHLSFASYTAATSEKVDPEYEASGRLLLGYFWAVSGKTAFALAEANIITETCETPRDRYLASELRSMAFYQRGWKKLAQQEHGQNQAWLQSDPNLGISPRDLLAAHLLLATVAMQQHELGMARLHLSEVAMITGVDWPYRIVDAMDDLEHGRIQEGLVKLKAIANDPSLPQELRKPLADGITRLEKDTGKVDSWMFWPKVVYKVLYRSIEASANQEVNGWMKEITGLVHKLGI